MLPLFFGAHCLVTAVLLHLLGVRSPTYLAIPWIFAGAFAATLVPGVRRRLVDGAWPWRLAPVVLYAAVISLASSVHATARMSISGNMFHPIEYAGLAFLAHYAWHRGFARPPQVYAALLIPLGGLLFGAVDELHQSFVPRRDASVLDVGLDGLGALTGTVVYLGMAWVARRWRARGGSSTKPGATSSP